MPQRDLMLTGSYNYAFVALSVLMAILASYAALEVTARVTVARAAVRWLWLVGGAIAMGIGIWSMHYIGMLAFHLPVPIEYDWPTVLLSLFAGVLSSALALFVASRQTMGSVRVWTASIFMGAGIAILHYTSMHAMRLQGVCHYSPPIVALSVILAIAFSFTALRLAFTFRDDSISWKWRKAAGAVLMGIAISAMHYTGMDGASFTRFAVAPDLSHAVSISSLGTAGIATVVVMVLGVAFLSCLADRIQMQRMLLDQLFEQAPEAVALIDVHNHVVRVNSEFTQVFGYTAEEILGRRLDDLIIPAGSQDEMQTKTELGARGQRTDAEGISRRKDGSQLQVAMIQVPVSVEGGLIAIYAIYRDITKYKQAEKALHVLSRRLLQLQDDERRRIAQDLHDSTAQLLASVTMNLSVVNESAHELDPRAARALAEIESLVDQCLREIRTVSYLLHPPELDHLGLQSALARYVDGFIQRSGIQIELDVALDLGRLPQELELAIFRIVQECLTNLHRHSNSHTGSIHLTRTPAELMLEVKDEGEGMRGNATLGIGIASMRERAQQFGGRLEIVSQDVGMKVKVVVPLSGAAPWTHFPS